MEKGDILGYVIIIMVLAVCGYTYYDNTESFQLKCIVSSVDGNKYCVRDRKRIAEAADLLATVTGKCKSLVAYMKEHHKDRDDVKRLVSGFNPDKVAFGNGLNNMVKRIEEIGGVCEVRTDEKQGTTIHIVINKTQ